MDLAKTARKAERLREDAERRRIYVDSGLSVDDPTQVMGLLERVSPDSTPLSAIDYDTGRTTKQKIDCAACGHKRNHHRGFLLTFRDGSRALVGIECGERDFFGEGAWGTLKNDLSRRKKAALFESRQQPVLRAIRSTIQVIQEWTEDMAPLNAFLRDFRSRFPELAEAFVKSAKRDGKLTRVQYRTVSVTLSDGRLVERELPVEETVVRLPAPAAFGGGFPSVSLERCIQALRHAEAKFADQDATQPKLAYALRNLSETRQWVMELHGIYSASRQFADVTLWGAVAKWARGASSRAGNYRVSGIRFRRSDQDYDYAEVRILKPEALPVIRLEPVLAGWPAL